MIDRLVASFERSPRPPRPGPVLRHEDVVLIAALFVATRLGLLAVAWLASLGVGGVEPFAPGDPFSTLIRWDSRWYIEVAEVGYHREAGVWPTGDGTNWAFFPLLPALLIGFRWLTGLGGPVGALIVTHLVFFGSLLLFFAYARELYGRAFARHAVVLFALWPFSVHHSVPMSESVFVPTTIAALWLARRGAFLGAGLAAALASATRAVGPFVAFPLLVIAARRHGFWRLASVQPGTERAVTALAACGVGVGLFILFMRGLVGDGLAFTHAQVAWSREFKWPWMTVIDELNPAILPLDWLGYNAFNLLVVVMALLLAWRLARLKLGAEALFVVIAVVLGLSAGQTTSLPRFLGAMAPLVVAVASLTLTHRRRRGAIGLSAALMLLAGYGWCVETLYVM